MSIESAIKAIHAAGLSDTQSEQFLSNDHLRRIVEVVLSEQWEPIETAPKNGSSMLLGYFNSAGNWRTLRGRWFSAEKIEMEWENADDFDAGWYEESVEADDIPNVWPTSPTHWQPLPQPPETKA